MYIHTCLLHTATIGTHDSIPIGTHDRVESHLVVVYPALVLPYEPVLLAVGPNACSPNQRLLEVSVDGRPCDRVQTLQLPSSGHINTLQGNNQLASSLPPGTPSHYSVTPMHGSLNESKPLK